MESEQNESLFADSYSQRSDGAYELTDFGREHRAELDDAMSMPLVAVHYADKSGMDLDQRKPLMMPAWCRSLTFKLCSMKRSRRWATHGRFHRGPAGTCRRKS